jgi:nicotinate dehydrogenase subunit B
MTATLPKSLVGNPRLSSWLSFDVDGEVGLHVGKVELGQGILTALVSIAATQLGVAPGRISATATSTADSPNEGLTAGSTSVTDSGAAVRRVCADVRGHFLAAAEKASGATADTITVVDGSFLDASGGTVGTYWSLHADLDVDADGAAAVTDGPDLDVSRIDLPDKVFGRPRFIQDLQLPGMLHARVIRPAGRGAHLLDVPEAEVLSMPGVNTIVRDGDFLAVVADAEDNVRRAAEFLAEQADWSAEETLPAQSELSTWLRAQPSEATDFRVADTASPPTHTATYSRPFLAHASIAPSCGLAHFSAGHLTVWSHSQGVFNLRQAIAQALGLDAADVTVQHVEGAGCYGHNAADDAAADAALIAMAIPDIPIRVQWTRADELGWGPFGAAMVADIGASLDADGTIAQWSYELWSNGHSSRPGYAGTPGLLGPSQREGAPPLAPAGDPAPERGLGSARNAEPPYRLPSLGITGHRALTMPIRTSAIRSLGSNLNVFAIESFMDELAATAGRDPLEFRLAHLDDERAREVLRLAATAGGWGEPLEGESVGRGIAYSRYKNRGSYCAVVAEVEVESDVRVRRLVIAVDVGRVISPDGVRNQIEGGAIQATSWAVKEQVTFDRSDVTSTDWDTYPILRFSEVPRVEVHLLDRPDQPSLGAGEATQGPVPAAIGNAIHAALGIRVRDLPLTPARIVEAIES